MKFVKKIRIFLFWLLIGFISIYGIHELNIWLSKKTNISLTCPYLEGKDVDKK
jgi:hypothetical protein